MAKISIDVEEIKKNLKETAQSAGKQLTDIAKKAQKDLSQNELVKKAEKVVELVKNAKAQDLLKNPAVADLAKKIVVLSEQLEDVVNKNTATLANQVRQTVSKATGVSSTSAKAAKKTAGTQKKTPMSRATQHSINR